MVEVIQLAFIVGNIILSFVIIYTAIKNYTCEKHWADLLAVAIGVGYLVNYIIILFFNEVNSPDYGAYFIRPVNMFAQTLIIVLLTLRSRPKC